MTGDAASRSRRGAVRRITAAKTGGQTGAASALFVSWARENGRTVDLAERLGIPALFVPRRWDRPILARYLGQFRATLRGLRDTAPGTVVLMLPPVPLLLSGLLHARLTGARVVGDLHTGAFLNPKWSWSTGIALRLLRPHTVVVTNEQLAERCRAAGIRSVLVLHDPLKAHEVTMREHARPIVVCPVSYNNDEPIPELLDAARRTPELEWVLTGRPPAAVVHAAPENVRLAGWLDDAAYDQLLSDADVVVALTTRPLTMQRAGYEALMRAKPLVTSASEVLTEFFDDAAVVVEPHSDSIAAGVRDAVARWDQLREAGKRVLSERIREQDAALGKLAEVVAGHRVPA